MVSYEVLESRAQPTDSLEERMNIAYMVRVMRVADQVLEAGKRAQLFGGEMAGWLTLIPRGRGVALSVCMNPSLGDFLAEEYQQRAEAEARWLKGQDRLTSSVRSRDAVDTAVAVTAYDFYLGYASGASVHLNEAFGVATAICLEQFKTSMVFSQQWHLHTNPHISPLVGVSRGIK